MVSTRHYRHSMQVQLNFNAAMVRLSSTIGCWVLPCNWNNGNMLIDTSYKRVLNSRKGLKNGPEGMFTAIGRDNRFLHFIVADVKQIVS